MPARRCSICSINWPNDMEFAHCPKCGGASWFATNNEPEFTHQEARDIKAAAAVEPSKESQPDLLHEHRFERYLALGFSEASATALAAAQEHHRDSQGKLWTRALNWQKVERALKAGATHEQAVAIFT